MVYGLYNNYHIGHCGRRTHCDLSDSDSGPENQLNSHLVIVSYIDGATKRGWLMAPVYSVACINARLQGVVDTIDGGGSNGFLILRQGTTNLVSIQLARPCGTISGGVLTFSGTLQDTASTTGSADNVIINDSVGTTVVSDLTVGIPLSGADVIVSNGLNSTLISAGQTVQVLSAQITGS